jgi:hypothetical protein
VVLVATQHADELMDAHFLKSKHAMCKHTRTDKYAEYICGFTHGDGASAPGFTPTDTALMPFAARIGMTARVRPGTSRCAAAAAAADMDTYINARTHLVTG